MVGNRAAGAAGAAGADAVAGGRETGWGEGEGVGKGDRGWHKESVGGSAGRKSGQGRRGDGLPGDWGGVVRG